MLSNEIAAIRQDYLQQALNEKDVAISPFEQFEIWFQQAVKAEITEVNAMTLSTIGLDGYPNGRIVLLKGLDSRGFQFFTNYDSAKGRELAANEKASLVFFWKELERQVRVRGNVVKLSDAESDEYFNSRPEGSRIGAWVSPQSREISGREWIEEKEQELKEYFEEHPLVRPAHWGGYVLEPVEIEFWQGRASRLHDRIRYIREDQQWKIVRLAP